MVILPRGNSKSEFLMALLTRLLDSSTALSAKPTIYILGVPWGELSASTSTGMASSPIIAAESILTDIGLVKSL